jgi:methyltransferase (TIGR00027 family)
VLRLFVFLAIQVLLYPLFLSGVIGYMLVIYLENRRKGVSGTAYEPFMNRLFAHDIGTRDDLPAKRLSRALPATQPVLWLLMMGPVYVGARVSGYLPSFAEYPPKRPVGLMSAVMMRTAFFDRTLEEVLPSVSQLVILGAGWDTRAYGLPEDWPGRVYEVDAPATQRAKRQALEAAEIETAHVTFVAVDFERSSWLDALCAQGFNPDQPAYLLFEGVSMYLTDTVVDETLASYSMLHPGSVIAFDYLPEELVQARPPWRLVGRLIPIAMKITYGEAFRFGVPTQPSAEIALEHWLAERKLKLLDWDHAGQPTLYGVCLVARARGSSP